MDSKTALLIFQMNGEVTQVVGTLHTWVFTDASGRRSYKNDVELVPYQSGGGLELRDSDSPQR